MIDPGDTPARRIADRRAQAGDLAQFDQARAEAAQDLRNLRAGFREQAERLGADAAHTAYVLGLVREWGPLSVASVLVEALRQMEGK